MSNQASFLQHVMRPRIIRALEWDDLNAPDALLKLERIASLVVKHRPVYFIVIPSNRMLRDSLATDWQRTIKNMLPHFEAITPATNFMILRYRKDEIQTDVYPVTADLPRRDP